MKNLLLSEKWRPKTIDDVILLPRIKKMFENGLTENVLFYGSFGTGKTTLARILIGKYSKDKPFIELNSSYHTSIDTLRSKIDDFCSKVYMALDVDTTSDSIKYVFLDEFDRTSIQYQDALKAYIEDYSKKNVRFILTTNHINKVSPGIRSRLASINFDCETPDEEKFLKNAIYKKIANEISPAENFTIPKEDLIKVINRKFPDFRSILVSMGTYILTGETTESTGTTNLKVKSDLYNIIYDRSKKFDDIYHFLMNNFGAEKIDEMISLLGRPFIEYSINEKKSNVELLFKVSYIITEHTKLLETNTDPIILGITVIGKIRDVLTE